MREISVEELKKVQFDMLIYIKKICDQYHLRYYLAYGTLLGAVRHGGYIPWDDDIDIMMPRKDYEKLLGIERSNPNEIYKIVAYETDQAYTLPFPKMIDTRTVLKQHYNLNETVELGVCIDIFLLDGVGNSWADVRKKKLESISLIKNWYRSAMIYNDKDKNKIIYLAKWIKNYRYRRRGVRYYLSEQKKHNSAIEFDNSAFVGVLDYNKDFGQENVWRIESFGYGTQLVFENVCFSVPCAYDEILKTLYGDYMKLPPENQRVSGHEYDVCWRI